MVLLGERRCSLQKAGETRRTAFRVDFDLILSRGQQQTNNLNTWVDGQTDKTKICLLLVVMGARECGCF